MLYLSMKITHTYTFIYIYMYVSEWYLPLERNKYFVLLQNRVTWKGTILVNYNSYRKINTIGFDCFWESKVIVIM